jgi:hypothetical protein
VPFFCSGSRLGCKCRPSRRRFLQACDSPPDLTAVSFEANEFGFQPTEFASTPTEFTFSVNWFTYLVTGVHLFPELVHVFAD